MKLQIETIYIPDPKGLLEDLITLFGENDIVESIVRKHTYKSTSSSIIPEDLLERSVDKETILKFYRDELIHRLRVKVSESLILTMLNHSDYGLLETSEPVNKISIETQQIQ